MVQNFLNGIMAEDTDGWKTGMDTEIDGKRGWLVNGTECCLRFGRFLCFGSENLNLLTFLIFWGSLPLLSAPEPELLASAPIVYPTPNLNVVSNCDTCVLHFCSCRMQR